MTPHGLRAGFVTTAYVNGVPDEEIMAHTRHRRLHHTRAGSSRPPGPVNVTMPSGALVAAKAFLRSAKAVTGGRGRLRPEVQYAGKGADRGGLRPAEITPSAPAGLG